MSYSQHPLSAAFPSMSDEELQMRLDGVIPSSKEFIDEVVSSTWFKALNKSQRAAYVIGWFHHLDRGSNQYKRKIDQKSIRFSAEAAQATLQRAAA